MAFGGSEGSLSGHLLVSEMMFVHYFHLFVYLYMKTMKPYLEVLIASILSNVFAVVDFISVFCHFCCCVFFSIREMLQFEKL